MEEEEQPPPNEEEFVSTSQLIYNVKKLESRLTNMIQMLGENEHLPEETALLKLKSMSTQMLHTGMEIRDKIQFLQLCEKHILENSHK